MLPQLVIVLHALKEALRTGPVPRDLAIAERIKIFVKMVILGGWALVALKLPSLHASLLASVMLSLHASLLVSVMLGLHASLLVCVMLSLQTRVLVSLTPRLQASLLVSVMLSLQTSILTIQSSYIRHL